MSIMDEIKLDEDIKKAIIDRLEGWELIDFLQISIDEVVDIFEEDIIDNIEDVLELIGLRSSKDEDED